MVAKSNSNNGNQTDIQALDKVSTAANSTRSKSIVSDESSDLSDLDSEAETERMYRGEEEGESELTKLSKKNRSVPSGVDGDVEDGDQEETKENGGNESTFITEEENTVIKEEIGNELNENKDIGEVIEDSDMKTVIENLNKLEKDEINNETNEITTNGKRKLEDAQVEEDDVKKQKVDSEGESSAPAKTEAEVEAEAEAKAEAEDVVVTESAPQEEKDEEVIKDEDNEKEDTDAKVQEDSVVADKTEEEEHDVEEDEDDDEDDENDELDEEEHEHDIEDGNLKEDEDQGEADEEEARKLKEQEEEIRQQKERKEAIEYLTEIEIEFAKLRDRLYDDKMTKFKSELEMCLDGSHPELQNVYTKIDLHREEKIKLATLNQKYRIDCINRTTIATRTSIHQQFFKRCSDERYKQLNSVTKNWYKINKERRELDLLSPEFKYKIKTFKDEVVDERLQVNEEINILTGLKNYFGFPKAPNLKPVIGNELNNDLREMKLLQK